MAPALATPRLLALALLSLLAACASNRPTPAAPPAPSTTAASASVDGSLLDDPAVLAQLHPCPPPDASGQTPRCIDGCEMIAGRCRRPLGGIQIPTAVPAPSGDAGR